jgi:hypothetical protein
MYIEIPKKFKELPVTEGQMLGIGFLYMISNDHGFIPYNINSYDFKKIMGSATVDLDSYNMRYLVQALHVSQINEDNWLIQFRDFKRQDFYKCKDGRGTRSFFKYEIKETRNIAMWCYLIGLYRGSKELIRESNKLFEYPNSLPTLDHHDMSFCNLRIENR